MAISFESALNAYDAAARRFVTGPDRDLQTGQAASPATGSAPSFQDLVGTAAKNAVGTMQEGERMSAQAVLGKADITEVVMAVNNAEITLQSVVAVRDRMISAYQEILRMPM
jgi:flagellar hook-basal body complex protein FliE